MEIGTLYCAGRTPAIKHAAEHLLRSGIHLSTAPDRNVTHLLLDIPSFRIDGSLRSGGQLTFLLEELPSDITIIGGNLEHPALATYRKIDLLTNEDYLAKNADITAHCAVRIAAPLLNITIAEAPALIIGWGRIGKCLGKLLRSMGCGVSVAARQPKDRAMLTALGYRAMDMDLADSLRQYRLIFNTVPAPVLDQFALENCQSGCVKIDLASRRGLDSADVIWARGLPGIHAPESSGRLICHTILSLRGEVGV